MTATPAGLRRLRTQLASACLRSYGLWLLACGGDAADSQTVESPDTGTHASTVVSLTFDDGTQDELMAAPMLEAHGMVGTFYVNSGPLGSSGFMTTDDVQQLASSGHEIGGHTVNHPDLRRADPDEQRRQICNDRVALSELGLSVRSFAYPFSGYTDEFDAIVADCGYRSARLVGGIMAQGACTKCPYAESIPPAEVFRMKTPGSVRTETTLDELEQYVLQAEEHAGGWVQLVFHRVCDACDANAIRADDLDTFLDWLALRAPNTRVATIGAIIGGDTLPAVMGPPSPPSAPRGMNMLHNPSLETDSDDRGTPDCWTYAGYGDNQFATSVDHEAADGQSAQTLEVTALRDGARRFISAQDLGQCAPTAEPDRSHTLSFMYKTTSAPRAVAFYRSALGGWTWLGQSDPLPLATDWTQYDWELPAMPETGTALSVGVSLESTGSVSVDQLSLVSR